MLPAPPPHGHPLGLLQQHARTSDAPRPQQRRSVIQGWPFSWLWWQIRPLERGGGQGCPSAPVFVHQLGLISNVFTVVHWFPLHVPHGFQTPSQNSSAPSPETSCLWSQAIFFPLFFPSHSPPFFFPLGSFQQGSPGQPCWGTCQVLQDDQGGHRHPPIVSSTDVFSDSSKPLCRTSPACHLARAAAVPGIRIPPAGKATCPQQRFLLI